MAKVVCPWENCKNEIEIDAHVVMGATLAGGMTCPACGKKIPDNEFVKQGILTDEELQAQQEGKPDTWRGKMVVK